MRNHGKIRVDDKLYVEDVFSSCPFVGNSNNRDIDTGNNLADDGGLVIIRRRNSITNWHVFDTARGPGKYLILNSNVVEATDLTTLTAFNTNGFKLAASSLVNDNAGLMGAWVFKQHPKFFKILRYTGNGLTRSLPHGMSVTPSTVIVKAISSPGNWIIGHGALGFTHFNTLNSSDAYSSNSSMWGNSAPTASDIFLGSGLTNTSGVEYVAYVFANSEVSAFVGMTMNSSGNVDRALDWEPQFLMTLGATSGTSSKLVLDTARRWDMSSSSGGSLVAATTAAETSSGNFGSPHSSGFTLNGQSASQTILFFAIRKGLMRKPTVATEVFDAIARTGTGSANVRAVVSSTMKRGVDLAVIKRRNSTTQHLFQDRVRGQASQLSSDNNSAEGTTATNVTYFNTDGLGLATNVIVNSSGIPYINYLFKEAKGFFDKVPYIGNSVARTIPHNLDAVPELITIKRRNTTTDWYVYYGTTGFYLNLNLSDARSNVAINSIWNNTAPTDKVFSVGDSSSLNNGNLIAYLFASCPGVSKIGTYIGTGAAQNIDCGFAAGARFVMIKQIDASSDWFYWDSVRGITNAADPLLRFNLTSAEITGTDHLTPLSTGFSVNASSAFNTLNGQFLYLAIA